MKIEVDMYQKIRSLYVHEGKSQREIARLLGVSRTTVKKYCEGEHVPWERNGTSGRVSYKVTDEVITFIKSCLEEDAKENIKKQKHTARRIYDRLVDELGFSGGQSTIRQTVADLRQVPSKAFVPLSFEPGEAVQIDWGEATIYLANKKVKINLFCMRQCFSADIFVKAFFRQNEESFLEGNACGFGHFQGVPTKVIFDNAKVAVKEGFGIHAKVQERYKVFAAHYAFKPEFCNIASGHEKGLVEGLVGWIRRNVLVPIPKVNSLDELNDELLRRCIKYRTHKITGRDITVGGMSEKERFLLQTLPKYKFDTSKSLTTKVDEFSTIKFDYNCYSVPFNYVGKDVSIKGYGNHVIILYRNTEIAKYTRCYMRNETLYQLDHYIDLIERRPRSVFNAKPVKSTVSEELIALGKKLSGPKEMIKLLRLCIDYGEDKVLKASKHLLIQDEISVEKIRVFLMPINNAAVIPIENDVKVRNTNLSKYDKLISKEGVAI